MPELAETLVLPNEVPILELDELWSFVLKKVNKRWIWIAPLSANAASRCLCDWRPFRQKLSEVMAENPQSISVCPACFTDLWEAYRKIIPSENHTAVGKETGETAHVERWNNTLRQRLGRFVRKTLSFSKSDVMHEICLFLFLHRYNNEPALSFV